MVDRAVQIIPNLNIASGIASPNGVIDIDHCSNGGLVRFPSDEELQVFWIVQINGIIRAQPNKVLEVDNSGDGRRNDECVIQYA